MFVAHSVRIVLQATSFIIVARALGPQRFGVFASVVAIVTLIAPLAALGSGNLLIKHVARDPKLFERYWGYALVVTLCSGLLLIPIVTVIARLVLPATTPLLLILTVAVAELLSARLWDVGGQTFQAFKRLGETARLHMLLSVSRFGAAVGMILTLRNPTPTAWAICYLCSTSVSAVIALRLVSRELGSPRWGIPRGRELREGMSFATALVAQGVYNDVDKALLARFATFEATGVYAAAYRVIDMAFTPMRAILSASYADFFQQGVHGICGSWSVAKQLFPVAAAYALVTGAGLYLFVPLLPLVLGTEYTSVQGAVRWLAALPFLKAMHYLLADALTGAGFQHVRTSVQVGVALFNIILNLWLIPTYSWRGAAWASIASDALLLVGLALMITFVSQGKPSGAAHKHLQVDKAHS